MSTLIGSVTFTQIIYLSAEQNRSVFLLLWSGGLHAWEMIRFGEGYLTDKQINKTATKPNKTHNSPNPQIQKQTVEINSQIKA